MQALRAMQIALTPDKKRQKVEDDSLVSDDEQDDHELMEEDENEVPQPRWANMERMLITIQGMMQEIQDEMNGVRNDVEEIKSELANVRLQAGFAQSSAQETLEAANSVEERVSMLEDTYVTKKSVEQMIDDAFQSLKKHTQTSFAALKVSASAFSTSSKPDADKFSRTAVVGGFENDTPKDEVIHFLQTQLCNDDQSIEETYVYNIGSVGFIRFLSRDAMFRFLRKMQDRNQYQREMASVFGFQHPKLQRKGLKQNTWENSRWHWWRQMWYLQTKYAWTTSEGSSS